MWVEILMQTRENMCRAWMHTTTAAYQLPGISPEGVVKYKKQYTLDRDRVQNCKFSQCGFAECWRVHPVTLIISL
jgi:hypothetical protein